MVLQPKNLTWTSFWIFAIARRNLSRKSEGKRDCYLFWSVKKDRPYVLKTKKKVWATYLAKNKKSTLTSWSRKKLIKMLSTNATHSSRAGNNQSESLDQELTNIILGKMVLKPLQGDAKSIVNKCMTLKILTQKNCYLIPCWIIFPLKKNEQMSEVGLVQKNGRNYVKDSIDRLLGYLSNKSDEKIPLCEMKARVVSTTGQEKLWESIGTSQWRERYFNMFKFIIILELHQ